MTIREYYQGLDTKSPRLRMIQALAKVTKKSPTTVRGWVLTTGKARQPDALTKARIAQMLHISAEELFPSENPESL